ncbi:MAG: hypothetical protein F9K45_03210 [Melioribacteraceae bacterium]|nr:MAG: hypothetical protein F9K45_03210 [Melioribacteraceae bacterium]
MDLYLVIVVILFLFAISDLVVGVANDAVNFLNSAIGSKVAPRYIIMIVASLGILIGTTFSTGLMEVARNGIIKPEQFYYHDVMIIFLSVMITDVILLDMFNTFGMPTSTTVSLIFELLGSAVAVSVVKIYSNAGTLAELGSYINTNKAIIIVFGILLSVVVAFSAGAIFQFLTRIIFTFDYQKRLKRYGALWGGAALTAITFFILIKGAKGSSIISPETQDWIKHHTEYLLLINFAVWAVILQLILWFTNYNILKPIVLIGTFALALAFAANDLVNFIGVPMAGLSSYQAGSQSPDQENLLMDVLNGPGETNTLLLLIAGGIMVLTLWFSKKANTVTKTEVNLGRQHEGFERFESTMLSRALVRMNIGLLNSVKKITPIPVQNFVTRRLDQNVLQSKKKKDQASFDLLRAASNLMVASMVISFGTSLKLPLSTTFVTFMVAMGTSFSDKAWGRESAVYRITGVLSVIGLWFFTAFIAFTASAVIATTVFYGGLYAIVGLMAIVTFTIYRSHILHSTKQKEEEELEAAYYEGSVNGLEAIKKCMNDSAIFLTTAGEVIELTYKGLKNEDREIIKKAKKDTKKLKKQTTVLISNIFNAVKNLQDEDEKKDRRYGKVIASIQSIYNDTKNINQKCFDHIDNNHKKPTNQQLDELKKINDLLNIQIIESGKIFTNKDFSSMEKFASAIEEFKQKLREFDENQLQRIKAGSSTTRGSLLYLGLLADSESLSNDIVELVSVCKKNYEGFSKK